MQWRCSGRTGLLWLFALAGLAVRAPSAGAQGEAPHVQKIIAVNAGGPSFVAADGTVYEADRYHNGGETSSYGTNYAITGTQDPELYQTERFHKPGRDLSYALPMPMNAQGLFTLTLKFSEVYFNQVGQKVFSVYVNGVQVIDRLDVFAKIGRQAAYDEMVDLEIDSARHKLWVAGKQRRFNETLQVSFRHTGRDNPKVNAILVQQVEELPGGEQAYRRLHERRKPARPSNGAGASDLQLICGVLLLVVLLGPMLLHKLRGFLAARSSSSEKAAGDRGGGGGGRGRQGGRRTKRA